MLYISIFVVLIKKVNNFNTTWPNISNMLNPKHIETKVEIVNDPWETAANDPAWVWQLIKDYEYDYDYIIASTSFKQSDGYKYNPYLVHYELCI